MMRSLLAQTFDVKGPRIFIHRNEDNDSRTYHVARAAAA